MFDVTAVFVVICSVVVVIPDELEITMPPMDVMTDDAYLCTSVKLPSTSFKLTGIKPRSDQQVAHHMLLFGCTEPGEDAKVWSCLSHAVCKGGDVVLYGWGRNAEPVVYPKGVAFSIGAATDITVLVLQVHYLSGRPSDDTSGITLTLSEEPSEQTASVIQYAAGFTIPPKQEVFPVRNKCCYAGFEPIHTVAFRVHTHELGRSVYMKKYISGSKHGVVIAQRHPLLPQGFVPVNQSNTVQPGEILEVTCEFNSTNRTTTVSAGATHNDEMCNMYMIVYSEIPHFGFCANDEGFYMDQKTGVMNPEGEFREDRVVSKYWTGSDLDLGQVVGVARGNDGLIWVLHRGGRTMDMIEEEGILYTKDQSLIPVETVLALDPKTGKVKASWGAKFFNIPHMITCAADGNLWITDVGRHQVFKFSPEGELLMTLGEKFSPGQNKTQFCAPTHVAILTDSSILVSDGYCNQRIMKFNPIGEFVGKLVDPSLKVPHSIRVDECKDVLYVADRDNHRVVYYPLSSLGDRLGEYALQGIRPMALTRGPYDSLLILAWSEETTIHQVRMVHKQLQYQGEWKVEAEGFPHDLTLSSAPVEITGAGDRLFALYIAEVTGQQLRKFILIPPNFSISTLPTDQEIENIHHEIKEYLEAQPVHENELEIPKTALPVSDSTLLHFASLLLPLIALVLAGLYFTRSRRKFHGNRNKGH